MSFIRHTFYLKYIMFEDISQYYPYQDCGHVIQVDREHTAEKEK
jgi:hypothetical protein